MLVSLWRQSCGFRAVVTTGGASQAQRAALQLFAALALIWQADSRYAGLWLCEHAARLRPCINSQMLQGCMQMAQLQQANSRETAEALEFDIECCDQATEAICCGYLD